jgi:hypothetical protein
VGKLPAAYDVGTFLYPPPHSIVMIALQQCTACATAEDDQLPHGAAAAPTAAGSQCSTVIVGGDPKPRH